LRYTYEVKAVASDGWAVVEFKHEKLGAISQAVWLPYDMPKETIHRTIAEKFPVQAFYARHLAIQGNKTDPALIEGELNISFEDHFYDLQVETVKTLEL
jgi:hypothetical protein